MAAVLAVQALCVVALAAVPQWHAWVHGVVEGGQVEHSHAHLDGPAAGGEEAEHHGPGSGHGLPQEHECAVTLFLAGAWSLVLALVFAIGRRLEVQSWRGRRAVRQVGSSCRARCIFEHAPPVGH